MDWLPFNFALLRNPYSWAVVLTIAAIGLLIAFRLEIAAKSDLPPTDVV